MRAFIRDPAFPLAGRIFEALRPLAPNGALIADMPPAFDAPPESVASALALLDQFGVLEFIGDGASRAARIERGTLACL